MSSLISFIEQNIELTIFILTILMTLCAGYIEIIYRARNTFNRKEKIDRFRTDLLEWFNEGGTDQEKYNNLLYQSPGAQNAMGSWGIVSYRPPFRNYMINNYQVVLNLVPEINQGLNDGITQRMAFKHMEMLDGALMRFLGHSDDISESWRKILVNPFRVFSRGANMILAFPIIMLLEFGLISKKIYSALVDSLLFKLFVFSVTMIGLISGIITIILGWEEFTSIISEVRFSLFPRGDE
jgi:hypothetical protein